MGGTFVVMVPSGAGSGSGGSSVAVGGRGGSAEIHGGFLGAFGSDMGGTGVGGCGVDLSIPLFGCVGRMDVVAVERRVAGRWR